MWGGGTGMAIQLLGGGRKKGWVSEERVQSPELEVGLLRERLYPATGLPIRRSIYMTGDRNKLQLANFYNYIKRIHRVL